MSEQDDERDEPEREVLARLNNELAEGLLDLIYRLERLEHLYGLAPQEPMTRLRPLASSEDTDAAMIEIAARIDILEGLAED